MAKKDLNERLKIREKTVGTERTFEGRPPVRALSPSMLVFRRFIRNRLAIAGVVVLTVMFLFSFVGPYLYRYGQTEVFYTYRTMDAGYAAAAERKEYVLYPLLETDAISTTAKNRTNSVIASMEAEGLTEKITTDEKTGSTLFTRKLGEGVYTLGTETEDAYVASVLSFDLYDPTAEFTEEMRVQALYHMYTDGEFSAEGSRYTAKGMQVLDSAGNAIAAASDFIVRDASGGDTLSMDFKDKVRSTIGQMSERGSTQGTFPYGLPQLDENGVPVGAVTDTEVTVTRRPSDYEISCRQTVYVMDRYAPPSGTHPFGTDGDGMDILARMMAGGRVSLLVGFVVVLLEVLLGVILGGLAGYFGGWTDNLIMRLVDVFYCIPSMPILIILGAMLDAIRMAPYVRLFWLMAVLGFLGWASIARLVRGQILSLREQDFMIAAEAAGLSVSRRIFRHLIPNVMPQLIVSATMGLGSVILTESTLSFLGLGVKHPMATWGTMINSVATSTETMVKYTHIWLPVGLLICLTVIAFNFAGDGLRDAFDPKMKR